MESMQVGIEYTEKFYDYYNTFPAWRFFLK